MAETKSMLASLVARLLGLDRVGNDENFFTLGAEGKFVDQIAAHLRERFDIQLSPEEIYGAPTVGEIADLLARRVGHAQPRAETEPLDQGWNVAPVEVITARAVSREDAPLESGAAAQTGRAWTPTRRRVASLWAELLNAADVGPSSDFFELGGNSLLAMRMVARANTEFGTDIPWALFLHHPNVADFSTTIDRALPNSAAPLRPSPRRDAARLLAELDQLSDQQVEALLRDMEATS